MSDNGSIMRRLWPYAALVALKVGLTAALFYVGFTHVSDDDYARIVIAQGWAKHPTLDASGTSWLPFPFWITGAAFVAVGRSLLVAKAVAVTQSLAAWMLFFYAANKTLLSRNTAWVATVLSMCLPWNLWLGATPVPEGFVPPLLAAAMLLATKPNGFAAVLLLLCTWSRYEAWPVALAVAAWWSTKATRERKPTWVAFAGVTVFGIVTWVLWNRVAHGDALHFFARVSRYRQSLDLPRVELITRLALYPSSTVSVMGPMAIFIVGTVLAVFRAREVWLLPIGLAFVQLFALIAGELADGAPTHHPQRAIMAVAIVLIAGGVDGLARWISTLRHRSAKMSESAILSLASFAALGAWLLQMWGSYPGQGDDDRKAQLARGRALDANATYLIAPCSYEHFALIAAFGRPEQVKIDTPQARTKPTTACPHITPQHLRE